MVANAAGPANTEDGSYGYGGPREKITENTFALTPIQMGARVYLPTLGRFTSRDMVQGGTANNYVYALDPINDSDYTGMWLHLSSVGKWIKQHAAAVVAVVIVVVIIVVAIYAPSALSTVARAAATISRSAVSTGTRIAGTIKNGGGSGGASNSAGSVSRAAARVVNNSTELPSARVSQINIDTKIAKQMSARGWDEGRIQQAINDPVRIVRTTDTRYTADGSRLNQPATAYYHQGGGYVVRNDATGDIVQISNLFKGNWIAPWE